MKIKNLAALCFDMDFTLVNYKLDKFIPMVHQCIAKTLVHKDKYPKSLINLEDNDVSPVRLRQNYFFILTL